MSGILLGVLAYIAVQFAVAILVSRRIKSETDYILGGRQLGVGLAAFSVLPPGSAPRPCWALPAVSTAAACRAPRVSRLPTP